MIHADTVKAVRAQVEGWRRQELRISLVPTMGNLHEGHLKLVARARQSSDRVVVSIFVNPMQFGEGEDFEGYPRTFDEDVRKLQDQGADLLYSPSVTEMYARPQKNQARVEVPGLSDILCGASRPGHFAGVATVVCKLFNQVRPDETVFGEKDFQQLLVIRRMVEDLNMPVKVIGYPIVRESDGLAKSSRNQYLTVEERAIAPVLHQCLQNVAKRLSIGETDFSALEAEARVRLSSAGFVTEYIEIRRRVDLGRPSLEETDLVVLAAAKLGKARLIDNLQVSRH